MHFTRLCPVTISDSESESDSECDYKMTDSKRPDSLCETKPDCESDSDELAENEPFLPYYKLSGHPLPCSVAQCNSKLFHIKAASVHYLLLRKFLYRVYRARKLHHVVFNIDTALHSGDFECLMKLCHIQTMDVFKVSGDAESSVPKGTTPRLGFLAWNPF